MQHTLLGEDKFQAGMRLYFRRHDGQAVTCDDFVQAMHDASAVDLSQFRRWYDTPGTPVLECSGAYADGKFTLTVRQSMNPPFHIPLAVKIGGEEKVLDLRSSVESFSFSNQKSKPVPSLLRRFSAPVVLNYAYSEDELLHLLANDDDAFNRWESAQRLYAATILEKKGEPSPRLIAALKNVLAGPDQAFAAEVLGLPAESFLAEQMGVVDPDALHSNRNSLKRALASGLSSEFKDLYQKTRNAGPYSPDPESIGRRSLRNTALSYLSEIGLSALCYEQ